VYGSFQTHLARLVRSRDDVAHRQLFALAVGHPAPGA
jgi:hypothetical protein